MNDATERRRRRAATTGLFFLTGLAMALWVVNIPTIQARTGVSSTTLGLLLLALGAGSVVGMQVGGVCSDRVGSRRAAALGATVIALAINGPALATSAWHLAVALPLYGFGNGVITVAANDQAVRIERAYGRPIMSAFHGFFSIAGALGAGLGALLHALDVPLSAALGTASLVVAVVGAVSVPRLLGPDESAETPGAAERGAPTGTPTSTTGGRSETRAAVALAVLAFLLMLAEGTATDWSTVHAVEHLHLDQSVAALAYGTFAVAMTVGRLTADRVVARTGPVAMVRGGSVLAAVGVLTVVLAPAYPLTLTGWLLFGLGLSGVVPQLFTAAGNLSATRRGVVLSRVVGAGYLGMLAGPAVIGWVADRVGIDRALLTPALACVAGVLLARVVRPREAGVLGTR
jgi:predicted MFS family arabinose efflux permease